MGSRRPYGTAAVLLARIPRISWVSCGCNHSSSRREEPVIAQDEILGQDPKAARRPVGPARNGEPARRIGITRQEVNRLTNLKHAAKIDRIAGAGQAALSRCGLSGGGSLRLIFDAAVSAGWLSSRREEPKIAQDEILGKQPRVSPPPRRAGAKCRLGSDSMIPRAAIDLDRIVGSM